MIETSLCPCGSGLRQIKCCALDLSTLSPASATAALTPMLAQAETLLNAGDITAAKALLQQFLELAPGREDALVLYHNLLRSQNNMPAAEVVIRRVVTLNPNNFWATNELTLMLINRG
ncbi:MAG: pilus assembly protein, partial [Acidocella sp. 35-58-6]